jgi:hypothetical protein
MSNPYLFPLGLAMVTRRGVRACECAWPTLWWLVGRLFARDLQACSPLRYPALPASPPTDEELPPATSPAETMSSKLKGTHHWERAQVAGLCWQLGMFGLVFAGSPPLGFLPLPAIYATSIPFPYSPYTRLNSTRCSCAGSTSPAPDVGGVWSSFCRPLTPVALATSHWYVC